MIVDDHVVVRTGLKAILGDCQGIEVVADVGSGQEAMDIAAAVALDIVILDIGMPDRDGLNVLQQLKEMQPSLGIIVFSMYSEEQYALRCFKNGASAYVSKQNPPEDLVEAVRAVAAGRKFVTQTIAEQMSALIQNREAPAHHGKLTDKEFRVLVKIGAGMPLAKIAEELFLSPKTVSAYKTRILKKLGMKNSASLIRYVIEEGLL